LSSATATRHRALPDRSLRLPVSERDTALLSSAFPGAGLADAGSATSVEPSRLARLLHPSARPERLSEAELLLLVGEICDQVPTERPTPGSTAGRRYVRLFRTEAAEAWIIAWAPSAYLGLHDHRDSRGAFQLVSGQLREVSTDLVDREPLTTLRLRAGAGRSLRSDHVHDLWNPTGEPALSVHVYSPPLRSMNFYSNDPDTYLAKLRTETEDQWPDPSHWAERAIG
jgi:hypothetical protein